jgi:hypothetical protein
MKKYLIGLILFVSCSNNPISYNSDEQDIKHLSDLITNQEIDTIIIADDNSTATVYYKSDTINDYFIGKSTLKVMNSNFADKALPWVQNAVVVGNWISDTSHFTAFYTISLYHDSIPFSAITDSSTIPIDTLKLLMRYLMDSTVRSINQEEIIIPIDNITYIRWGSTISLRLQGDDGSLTVYTFRFYNNILSNLVGIKRLPPIEINVITMTAIDSQYPGDFDPAPEMRNRGVLFYDHS